LLYDGLYAPRGSGHFVPVGQGAGALRSPQDLAAVVSFFTVPTMGMDPGAAEQAIPAVTQVMSWLRAHYAPPEFPGRVDAHQAGRGRILYGERCARCHGDYDDSPDHPKLLRFPNRPSPQEEMGTDAQRWKTADSRLVQALAGTAYVHHVSSTPGSGYVAPILSGLWATAPYLHNGSVPTLWQLMNPELRPARFQVGGHRLDYVDVGIAGSMDDHNIYRYPAGYRPWSVPEIYDTARPGHSNRGHEAEFTSLSQEDKRALLEYLKEF
jgi:mono/diheme cytochrome c family protein